MQLFPRMIKSPLTVMYESRKTPPPAPLPSAINTGNMLESKMRTTTPRVQVPFKLGSPVEICAPRAFKSFWAGKPRCSAN